MKKLYQLLFAIMFLYIASINISFAQQSNPAVVHPLDLNPLMQPFYHGVASGDPLSDRVIIWTRVTPDTNSPATISVDWKIASDTNFSNVLNSGTVSTDAVADYTVKIDATGLQPNAVYYYQFTALGKNSVIGRTKTAPQSTADVDSLRFAFVACSNYPYGYFNSYAAIKKANDIDAVIHLGDYIYEYGDGYSSGTLPERQNEPLKEIWELSEYRTRYSHYRLDPDLRKLHQQYPWMLVWDDHESANDSHRDGAENHTAGTEGNWTDRKNYAMQAWTEWLPVRKPNSLDSMQIYRKVSYGNLANIYLLDTRLFDRDQQNYNATNDTSHKLLGPVQRNWLYSEMLADSATQWKILAQQVMVAPLSAGSFLNNLQQIKDLKADMWEGYNSERQSLINHVLNNDINNVVVITGDIHTSWANDIPTGSYQSGSGGNPATGSAMVEFVTTSVTSPGLEAWLGSGINSQLPGVIYPNNPHIKYVNLDEKGYNILDLNKTRTQNDFYFVNTIAEPNDSSEAKEFWYVNKNERALRKVTSKSNPRSELTSIPFAPDEPFYVGINEKLPAQEIVVFAVYPNPVSDYAIVQFYLRSASDVNVKVVDVTGKIISGNSSVHVSQGMHLHGIDLKNIAEGIYFLIIETDNYRTTQKLFKGK